MTVLIFRSQLFLLLLFFSNQCRVSAYFYNIPSSAAHHISLYIGRYWKGVNPGLL
jgi:hypothetical protein